MTIDKAKLKALAQAATPGPWQPRDECGFEVFPDPQGMLIARINRDGDMNFIAAANPAVILALLSDIERLERHKQALVDLRVTHGFDSWSAALVEIEKLSAELAGLRTGFEAQNEVIAGLRKDAARYRWIMENLDLRCDGEYLDGDADVDAAMTGAATSDS